MNPFTHARSYETTISLYIQHSLLYARTCNVNKKRCLNSWSWPTLRYCSCIYLRQTVTDLMTAGPWTGCKLGISQMWSRHSSCQHELSLLPCVFVWCGRNMGFSIVYFLPVTLTDISPSGIFHEHKPKCFAFLLHMARKCRLLVCKHYN